MSRPKAWYEFHASKFEADTAHLTNEETGAYVRLLNFHFSHGFIPDDIDRIRSIIRENRQKTLKIVRVLEPFFYKENGRFYQKRMVKTIDKAIEISEKRKAAGTKGGRAYARAIARAKGKAKPETVTNTITNKDIKHTVQTASRFEQWWDAYGLKKNRKGALKIWKSRKLDSMADELIADALHRHQHDADWKSGFQPHPTTYLNGDRWNDELTQARPGARKSAVSEREERNRAALRG